MLASANRDDAIREAETIMPAHPMSIPCLQVIEMIRLSNGSVL
jgi:hypothetical protein